MPPHGAMYAAFGDPDTVAENLVAVSIDKSRLEIIHLPEGNSVAGLDMPFLGFLPFFSPDGRYLSFGSQTGGAFVIDVERVLETGNIEAAIVLNPLVEGGPTNYSAVGGGYLATTHSGEVVRLWSVDTGSAYTAINVATGRATFISFSPDERYLYYADRGGLMRRLPLDPGDLVDLARSRLTRDLTVDECRRFLDDGGCDRYEES